MISSSNSVLIVDADSNHRETISSFFHKIGWVVHTAKDGSQAIKDTHKYLPDIIVMDIELPIRDGITACRLIKNDVGLPRYFPIIMMSASRDRKKIVHSIESGCDDVILKPFKFDALFTKVEQLVNFYYKKKEKEEAKEIIDVEIKEETKIIIYSKQVIKRAFANALDDKLIDYPVIQNVINKMTEILRKVNRLPLAYKMKSYSEYTYIHSINVASLCLAFAYHLKWDDLDLQTLGEGAFLHDIGMSRIDLQTYMKLGNLTSQELSEIQKHPLLGREILAKQNIQNNILNIATEHHERQDGSGYPNKLSDNQISKYGKLTAIVDVYDALTTDRCFRGAINSDKAIDTMSNLSGHFDPEYFQEFARLVNSETIGK